MIGTESNLKAFLDRKVAQYNSPSFIPHDPICIPHRFSKRQDIEIMGFFAAILAWGQRKTIINKCTELIERMDGSPYMFIREHESSDLKSLLGFKHRTFNEVDLLYFVHFFRQHYEQYESLEDAFLMRQDSGVYNESYRSEISASGSCSVVGEYASAPCYVHEIGFSIEESLNAFRHYFFSLPDFPVRTRKHISSPMQKSACKRINMFLRWMVRKDEQGVDFGIWSRILPQHLIAPCDVHVERVARHFGLITRKQSDWQTALELTRNLRLFDVEDPVKYDFALFGLGVEGEL